MNSLGKFWNKYGWWIIAILSISLILFAYFFDNRKVSNYDFSFLFRNKKLNKKNHSKSNYNQENDKENVKEYNPNYMSKGELRCKQAIEKIFNKPFQKIRPDFLKNQVTGKNLELDLYNPELKLSVEMNGIQHYKFTPFFHKNNETFLNQRYRDEMKKVKCRENGVNIIEVPYTVDYDNIEDYIRQKAKEFGYRV